MTLAFIVYLAGVIGSLGEVIFFACLMSLCVLIIYSLAYVENCTSDNQYQMKFLWITVSLALFTSLLPSEKTMWMMAGAYSAQTVVQSQVGQDLIKIVELKVKKQLEEAIGEKK